MARTMLTCGDCGHVGNATWDWELGGRRGGGDYHRDQIAEVIGED